MSVSHGVGHEIRATQSFSALRERVATDFEFGAKHAVAAMVCRCLRCHRTPLEPCCLSRMGAIRAQAAEDSCNDCFREINAAVLNGRLWPRAALRSALASISRITTACDPKPALPTGSFRAGPLPNCQGAGWLVPPRERRRQLEHQFLRRFTNSSALAVQPKSISTDRSDAS
jgi:hypothetical protein